MQTFLFHYLGQCTFVFGDICIKFCPHSFPQPDNYALRIAKSNFLSNQTKTINFYNLHQLYSITRKARNYSPWNSITPVHEAFYRLYLVIPANRFGVIEAFSTIATKCKYFNFSASLLGIQVPMLINLFLYTPSVIEITPLHNGVR